MIDSEKEKIWGAYNHSSKIRVISMICNYRTRDWMVEFRDKRKGKKNFIRFIFNKENEFLRMEMNTCP